LKITIAAVFNGVLYVRPQEFVW